MARNKRIKQKRDKAIYDRMKELKSIRDNRGFKRHSYMWCLGKVADEFYLAPDTIQDIYLEQCRKHSDEQ